MKKGKKTAKVPNLRFPGFEGEWVVMTLREVAQIVGGGTPETSIEEYWNGNIQWFTPTEIKSNFVTKSNRTITELGLKKSSAKLLPQGTILLTTRATIGDVAIATQECTTNQGFQSLIVNKKANNIFISNWIKQNKNEFIKRANGSTFAEISKSEVEQIPILIPLIQEQERISTFLSLIDERIETQNKIIESLKTQMLGLQGKLFRQKIKLKNSTKKVFPSWKYKNGGEVFKNISNRSHNSDLPILAITQEQGAVPRELIHYQIIVTERSIKSYKVVESGDFIISLRSFQGGIEHSDYKGICSPAYIILRNKIEIAPDFYKYYFKTPDYIKELNKKLEGIRDGKMISYSYFAEIPVPFPILEEQKAIASFLTKIHQKIQNEKIVLEQLEMQKKYLLANLFI